MPDLVLSLSQKFALLAVGSVYTKLSDDDEQLSDGTWVLNHVPVQAKEHWEKWIGSLRSDQINAANLVFVRVLDSQNPAIAGDDEQDSLTQHLDKLFSMLQLGGVAEYLEADLLAGAVLDDGPTIRQISKLQPYRNTKGYQRKPIDRIRLETAALLRAALENVEAGRPAKFPRFMLGLNVLNDGLRQNRGQERLHQFVRSLEALILPDEGRTRKQFVHRCQTFANVDPAILTEMFDMRSDAEHLQDWHRALQTHPADDRQHVALHRTRQVERLAQFAYSRILLDKALLAHFEDDTVQTAFWKLDDGLRGTTWGEQLDLSTIPMVRHYNGFNRGVASQTT